jgi:hypothetical protein
MGFFTAQPLWISAAIIVGVPNPYGEAWAFFMHRCFAFDLLTTNNDVPGVKFVTLKGGGRTIGALGRAV